LRLAAAFQASTSCSKRSLTPDHADAKEWAGEYPDTYDELPIKYANRRNAAKARIAKKK